MRTMLAAALCVVAWSAWAQTPVPGQWTAPTTDLRPGWEYNDLVDRALPMVNGQSYPLNPEIGPRPVWSEGARSAINASRPTDADLERAVDMCGRLPPSVDCEHVRAERDRREGAFVARVAGEIGQ